MVARVIRVCALVLLLGPPAVFAQMPSGSVTPPRRVAGTVVDVQTRVGLAGVRVRLIPVPADRTDNATQGAAASAVAPVTPEAVTGAEGRFTFDAVAAGRYRVTVALDGFQPFTDPREIVVAGDSDPPPAVIDYALRMTTEVQAHAEAAPTAQDTAAGSQMNALPGRAVVVAPGALEDVMRTFQMRPGVAASQDDRNDMLVRGGGAIENATRIDGFDIPNPSHFGTPGSSGGAFSIISPWLIDRAVLRAGGFSVEFGERASSVLDLTLKPVASDRIHAQAGASVGGAMGEAEGSFAGGRGAWLVSARRSFLELAFSRGSDRAVPHYGDLIGRLDYSLSPAHHVEILGIGSIDDVIVTSIGSNAIRDNQAVSVFGASVRSQWTPGTTTAVFASYARTGVDAEVGGSTTADGSDRSTEVELRMRGEVRRRLGRDGELMAGVAMKHPDMLFGLDAKGFRNNFAVYVNPLHAHFPYSFTDAGTYAELRLPSLARLQLTPGIRVDRMGATRRFYTTPRINGQYRITGRVRLTGAYGVYRQTLPYVWIGSDVRNASLDPVRSRQALAGVSLQLPGRTRLVVEGFDKRYSGYPVDAATQWWHVLVDAAADYESPFVGQLAGAGRILARGIDTSVGRRFANRLDLSASYSYWHVSQQSSYVPPGYTGPVVWQQWLPADYDIRHQVRVDFAYDAPGKWRFATQWRYASGRPYTPFDVAASVHLHTGRMDISSFNSAAYPAYHRLDMRFDRIFAVWRTRLIVYGELDNVYNRDNLYIYEWNRTARQTRPIYQWGRLPIGGLRWEF